MRYTDLDRSARYAVRVIYGGDAPKIPVRLVRTGSFEIHGFREKPRPRPQPLEFDIPSAATASGELTLEWTKPQAAEVMGGVSGCGRSGRFASPESGCRPCEKTHHN